MQNKSFEAVISVGGRFHAFNLAYQLEKRGHLQKLITSYPKFETVKYGISKDRIESIIIKEILQRGWRKIPKFIRNSCDPRYLIREIFDKLASRKIEKTDLFIGWWAGYSLHTLKKANDLGTVTVLESGSSHIEFQQSILKEEYEKYAIKKNTGHPKIVEKQLQEYKEANYISLPSKFAIRTFKDKGFPEEKLLHIPYGVDLSEFKQLPKEDDVFRVVFAGGMTLQKGLHYLLQAFAELNLPNSELILLGSKTDEIKPFFKKYEGHYKFIGHKPQKELHKYYSQGSVFVLPSIQDGFGMVMIQAMACGLPVIATTNTGGPDIIEEGENGFVIPIRDTEALKEKLVYLYKHPKEREKMGQEAKKTAESGFTWDDYGDRIVKEYQRILNERK